jgi:hypothetical protein
MPCYLYRAEDIPFASDLSTAETRINDIRRLTTHRVPKNEGIEQIARAFHLAPQWTDQLDQAI